MIASGAIELCGSSPSRRATSLDGIEPIAWPSRMTVPVARLEHARERAQQRRLAARVRADDRGERAVRDRHVELLGDDALVVGERQRRGRAGAARSSAPPAPLARQQPGQVDAAADPGHHAHRQLRGRRTAAGWRSRRRAAARRPSARRRRRPGRSRGSAGGRSAARRARRRRSARPTRWRPRTGRPRRGSAPAASARPRRRARARCRRRARACAAGGSAARSPAAAPRARAAIGRTCSQPRPLRRAGEPDLGGLRLLERRAREQVVGDRDQHRG